jgi:hypothetical protein
MFCRSTLCLQSLRKLSQNFVSHFSHILSSDGKWRREGHIWDKILGLRFLSFESKLSGVRSYNWLYSAQWCLVTEDTHVTQNLHHHLLLSTAIPLTLDTINTSSVTTRFLFSYMDFTHLIFSYLHDLLSTLHHFC